MIKAGFFSGPLRYCPDSVLRNSTDNKLLLIRFLGTFLRVKSLSLTTYISDMSESGIWLKMNEKGRLKHFAKFEGHFFIDASEAKQQGKDYFIGYFISNYT